MNDLTNRDISDRVRYKLLPRGVLNQTGVVDDNQPSLDSVLEFPNVCGLR